MSQVKTLLGINAPNDKVLHWMIYNIFANITQTHWPTVLMGLIFLIGFFIFQYGFIKYPWKVMGQWKWFKFELKKIPSSLIMVFIGIISIYLMKVIGNYKPDETNLQEVYGIKIIGKIESGFPTPTFPIPSDLSWSKFQELFLVCIPIAIIAFLEVFKF